MIKIFNRSWSALWEDICESIKMTKKRILKSPAAQWLFSRAIRGYIKFVFWTSKVDIRNADNYWELMKGGRANFVVSWHSGIMMVPIITSRVLSGIAEVKDRLYVVNSRHSDGQLTGKVMNFFGYGEISGSSINGNKLDQAEDSGAVKSIMVIMRKLKEGASIQVALDAPRGPAERINGNTTTIAKKMNVPLIPLKLKYSIKWRLHTWDRFQIPLPFGKIEADFTEVINPNDYANLEELNAILERRIGNGCENG